VTGLALTAAAAVRAPVREEEFDQALAADFFRDLLGPFGAEPDDERLARGSRVQHRQMARTLVATEGIRDRRPQLIVITHALPDLVPFTAVAPMLAEQLGGAATCFAISEQGLAAPFTALRVAAGYHRSSRADEVVLAVLEQTTLPQPMPLVDNHALIDSGALLVLGRAGGGGMALCRAGRSATVADALSGLPADDRTQVVLGSWAGEPVPAGYAVHRAEPGSYCTGVWLELAENWAAWQERYRSVVLCDTDPASGFTFSAVFAAR
jgi:hypothetical protein